MPARVQSPSSINTYKQCPRKYFYQYIKKLETKPNIHTLRGNIVHSVLEEFFSLKDVPSADYHVAFQREALMLLQKHWMANTLALTQVADPEALSFYSHESQLMVVNWINFFTRRFEREMRKGKTPAEAFIALTPTVEQEMYSPTHQVRGFIDAIETGDDGVRIMDYKTSKSNEISDQYRLQLGIYALLYEDRHGKRPDKVGIYFLNSSEKTLDVSDTLIDHAKREVEKVHACTTSEEQTDYPMKPSRLCKWSTGQCDFYGQCFKNEGQLRQELLKVKY